MLLNLNNSFFNINVKFFERICSDLKRKFYYNIKQSIKTMKKQVINMNCVYVYLIMSKKESKRLFIYVY